MLQKCLVYISLWILFQLLIEINCQISAHKRWRHTATLIDNKLYILGGSDANEVGKDFFYIDFSVPFNTRNLLLTDLSNVNTVPPHYNAGSAKGGANNDTLFIFRGITDILVKMENVYRFDPQSNSWSIPITTGETPLIVDASKAVIDQNGRMYLWAGAGLDVFIFDTLNLVWTKKSSVGAPNVGLVNSATLLPDNKIIYIVEGISSDNLSQVYIYDTMNGIWTTKTTSGIIPPSKLGMTAVLGLDGQRMIIFGGLDFISKEPLYELSLINFEWRIPKTSGPNPEAILNGHKANVIGNYMVISFGLSYTTENDILLLDISNVNEYIWTNEFKPSPSSLIKSSASVPIKPPASLSPLSPLSPPISSQKSEKNNSNIAGVVIGSMIGGALLSFVGVSLYKCINNNNRNGNSNNVRLGQERMQPLTESNYHSGQERMQSLTKSNYHPGQERMQPLTESNYHPGQERMQPPIESNNHPGQERIKPPVESNYNTQAERINYYPGQEIEQPPASATNSMRNN